MKKILIGLCVFITLYSCSNEYYDNLNHDPLKPESVPANYLVTSATLKYFHIMLNTSVTKNIFRLVAQQWNETTYTEESNYNIEARDVNINFWNELYVDVLYDLENAKEIIENDQSLSDITKANQLAIVNLLQIQAWQTLVDTFGDIPYSEALKGFDEVAPKYDDAKVIYEDLVKRAVEATNKLDESEAGFGNIDIIYGGNIAKWKKFGASLLLKLGVQLADINPSLAETTIINAVSTGVFISQEDNFSIIYTGVTPYTHPLWEDLVLSGRSDFVAANTIIDYMNELNDPRRDKYFRQNLGEGIYIGGTYGAATSYASFSQASDLLHNPNYIGTLLDYTEVQFLLAEAAARGISVGDSEENLYKLAIKASFDFWKKTDEEADEYIAQTEVDYNTSAGTWKEKIGKQAWIAQYNKGFDAWTSYRRLDAPKLNIAANTGLPVPKRFTYPVRERNINKVNNNNASIAIGGDEQQSRIFWDVY